MQVIILAARMGRRLGDLTNSDTKCILEINGIKLIDRVFWTRNSAHIEKAVMQKMCLYSIGALQYNKAFKVNAVKLRA